LAVLISMLCPASAPPTWAGTNAGGALFLHAALDVQYTTTRDDYCGDLGITDCRSAANRVDGNERTVLYVIAAFDPDNLPRLRGVSFGLRYPQNIHVVAHGSCADFEMCQAAWPLSGYGTTVIWNTTQNETFVPVYWLAAYNASGAPAVMELIAHNQHGANFADDSIPANLDPILHLGTMGFDAPGSTPCPRPKSLSGACCLVDGSCAFLEREECAGRDGLFQGDNMPCNVATCSPAMGACCLVDGTCVVRNIFGCSDDAHAIWMGRDWVCDPDPCPNVEIAGACCFADGSCTWVSGRDCRTSSGIFYGNIDQGACDPNPCPGPPRLGSCCALDGGCTLLGQDDCRLSGGVDWFDSQSCDPNPCPQGELGPCCTPNGSCMVTTEWRCTGSDGSPGLGAWLGYAGGCDPNPCPMTPSSGACCDLGGTCQVMIDCLCSCSGRLYLGDGTTCDPNPCLDVVSGACCIPDGDCRLAPVELCTTLDGVYKGDESVCDPDPCNSEPGTAIPGACCLSDGSCVLVVAVDCAKQGGVSHQAASGCDPKPCQKAVATRRVSWGGIKARYQ